MTATKLISVEDLIANLALESFYSMRPVVLHEPGGKVRTMDCCATASEKYGDLTVGGWWVSWPREGMLITLNIAVREKFM